MAEEDSVARADALLEADDKEFPKEVLDERQRKLLHRYVSVILKTEEEKGPEDPDIIVVSNTAGVSLLKAGHFQRALKFFARTIAIAEKLDDERYMKLISIASHNSAMINKDCGRLEEATSFAKRCVEIRTKLYGVDNADTATSLMVLAGIEKAQGNFQVALDHLQQARTTFLAQYGSQHMQVARCEHALAMVHRCLGQHAEAVELFEHHLAVLKELLPADHADIVLAHNNLAVALVEIGRKEDALVHFDVVKTSWDTDTIHQRRLVPVLKNLSKLYKELGREEESVAAADQARLKDEASKTSDGASIGGAMRALLTGKRWLSRTRAKMDDASSTGTSEIESVSSPLNSEGDDFMNLVIDKEPIQLAEEPGATAEDPEMELNHT